VLVFAREELMPTRIAPFLDVARIFRSCLDLFLENVSLRQHLGFWGRGIRNRNGCIQRFMSYQVAVRPPNLKRGFHELLWLAVVRKWRLYRQVSKSWVAN
jgi:hypothetical protein